MGALGNDNKIFFYLELSKNQHNEKTFNTTANINSIRLFI